LIINVIYGILCPNVTDDVRLVSCELLVKNTNSGERVPVEDLLLLVDLNRPLPSYAKASAGETLKT
jgi:hypothetical protein